MVKISKALTKRINMKLHHAFLPATLLVSSGLYAQEKIEPYTGNINAVSEYCRLASIDLYSAGWDFLFENDKNSSDVIINKIKKNKSYTQSPEVVKNAMALVAVDLSLIPHRYPEMFKDGKPISGTGAATMINEQINKFGDWCNYNRIHPLHI